MPKNLAVFDYDRTLILGDSLWPFLCAAAGTPRAYAALAEAAAQKTLHRLRGIDSGSTRTFVKAHLLKNLLAGKRRDELNDAATRTRLWQKKNPPVLRWLHEHRANGDIILIASGALDLYMPELLRDIPHDALICTDIGVENGIVTGRMTHGNCVRLRKAERLAEWLAQNGPFDHTFGYGNYPHDVPMLDLLQHRIIVS